MEVSDIVNKVQLNEVQCRVNNKLSGSRVILNDVSMSIPAGRVFTLVGPSGSGKSTLLGILNRLRDYSAGSILLDGQELCQLDVLSLRRRVGMLMQQPFMFEGTVADNINFGPSLQNQQVDVGKLLAAVGLENALHAQEAKTLSGGQQQRVALARILATNPEVLLLDEPTSALDPQSTADIEGLITRLARQGMTVLWVTHNMEQAQRVGNYTGLMVAGKLVESAPTEEFFRGINPMVKQFLAGDQS